jgi:hypothetical protein
VHNHAGFPSRDLSPRAQTGSAEYRIAKCDVTNKRRAANVPTVPRTRLGQRNSLSSSNTPGRPSPRASRRPADLWLPRPGGSGPTCCSSRLTPCRLLLGAGDSSLGRCPPRSSRTRAAFELRLTIARTRRTGGTAPRSPAHSLTRPRLRGGGFGPFLARRPLGPSQEPPHLLRHQPAN